MRIRRVTYDLGNVIERQEYLGGRYGAPGEKRAKKKKATPVKWSRSTNGPGRGKPGIDSECISKRMITSSHSHIRKKNVRRT